MSSRDEKLSADLGEAAELAFAEHLSTLRLELPAQEIDTVNPKTGEVATVANPLWIKIKTLRNKAASDIFRVMVAVDPQAMKGRKTDRTKNVLDRVFGWSGEKSQTTQ